jgi:flagellar hook-basal body complex protein FliE
LKSVNDRKLETNEMIKSFASGKTQNVHELMISMQKASVAMSMTTAVRSKVMAAYKEVMSMSV